MEGKLGEERVCPESGAEGACRQIGKSGGKSKTRPDRRGLRSLAKGCSFFLVRGEEASE